MSVDFWNGSVEVSRFGAFFHQRRHRSFVRFSRLDDALVLRVEDLIEMKHSFTVYTEARIRAYDNPSLL